MTNAHATMKLLTMRTKVEKNIIIYTNNKRTFVQFILAYWQVVVVISGPELNRETGRVFNSGRRWCRQWTSFKALQNRVSSASLELGQTLVHSTTAVPFPITWQPDTMLGDWQVLWCRRFRVCNKLPASFLASNRRFRIFQATAERRDRWSRPMR